MVGALPARVVVAALVAGALGCASPARREATSLTMAVDAFRHAPAAVRAQRAHAVSEVACTDTKVCEAKQACVAAIDPTAQALALMDEVRLKAAEVEKGLIARDSPEAVALPGKLDEADRLLRQGKDRMAECDGKLKDLAVAYGS